MGEDLNSCGCTLHSAVDKVQPVLSTLSRQRLGKSCGRRRRPKQRRGYDAWVSKADDSPTSKKAKVEGHKGKEAKGEAKQKCKATSGPISQSRALSRWKEHSKLKPTPPHNPKPNTRHASRALVWHQLLTKQRTSPGDPCKVDPRLRALARDSALSGPCLVPVVHDVEHFRLAARLRSVLAFLDHDVGCWSGLCALLR